MKEIWKDIKGYENVYQISNLGHVRTVDRQIHYLSKYGNPSSAFRRGLPIKAETKVTLSKHDIRYLDRLVLETFNDIQLTDWDEITHLDGDHKNNALSNLTWHYILLEDREWRDVVGAEGLYKVSEYGDVIRCPRVQSTKQGNMSVPCMTMRRTPDKDGYLRTFIVCGSLHREKGCHQYVAEAFIPNPENKPTVNHIDGNKQNNHVSNLEWATYQEQSDHAASIGLRTQNTYSNRKRVKEVLSMKVRCIETGDVYDSMIEAERQLGLWFGAVSESCNKGRSIHGLHFERI